MAAHKEKAALEAELARELVHIGLPEPEARELARRQLTASAVPNHDPPQHVVPVSRGWIVIRDFANLDIGLFEKKEDALAEARRLAGAAETHVIVHEEDG